MNGKYRVNEIFYSLQGEGFWTGTPMVFLRLSGCNLACPFCDTLHAMGQWMDSGDILREIQAAGGDCRRVCITGGEPSLQLDAALVEILHGAGYTLHVETNGTRPLPDGVDWVCLSPKEVFGGEVVLGGADELKLVFDGDDARISRWAAFPSAWHFLQPCDSPDAELSRRNTAATMDYVASHPQWRLSLQTHKLIGIR